MALRLPKIKTTHFSPFPGAKDLSREEEFNEMKILKQIFLTVVFVIGISSGVSAQDKDQKRLPPKNPPVINPGEKPPKEKPPKEKPPKNEDRNKDNRGKKP